MTNHVFYSGRLNYKKHTHTIGLGTQQFATHISDVETEDFQTFDNIIARDLGSRGNKTVEVLYSGGMDSELVLASCIKQHIPCVAVTMKLMGNGCVLNTHDLYYSERFCRNNSIPHKIIELDCDRFFDNGDHIAYLEPFLITHPHVATHFWLFEQCESFPVIGGDYPWPWVYPRIISPFRHHYCYYDEFMKKRNITGIGNILSYSLEASMFGASKHTELVEGNPGEYDGTPRRIARLKHRLYSDFLGTELEQRFRSDGWTQLPVTVFNLGQYRGDLYKRFKVVETDTSISWEQKMATAIGGVPGSNNRFS